MKLSALMADYTPSAEFAGVATNDDFVLAVDIAEETAGKVANYIVVQSGIASVDSQLNPETDEKAYIRQGAVSTKTSTQKVVKPYVYFSLLTGEGEKGTASIIVNSDGSGDAGASSEIDIDIMATSAPAAYTYSDDSGV